LSCAAPGILKNNVAARKRITSMQGGQTQRLFFVFQRLLKQRGHGTR
jgi:hypothetical protein